MPAGGQHDVLKPADVGADDREPGGDGLDQDGAGGFASGRVDQAIRGAEEFREVGAAAVEDDAIGDPELGGKGFAAVAAVIAGEEKTQARTAFPWNPMSSSLGHVERQQACRFVCLCRSQECS